MAVVPRALESFELVGPVLGPLTPRFEIVAAAGMGASFFALFKANRYVVNNTFDPNFEPTYWVRFALGLIAGTLLGLFVNVGGPLGKPTLAALGGFSADAVQRILTRLVEALSSLVRGETRELIAAQEQALKADLNEQSTEFRLGIASDLVKVQGELRDLGLREEKRRVLDGRTQVLINRLFGRSDESTPWNQLLPVQFVRSAAPRRALGTPASVPNAERHLVCPTAQRRFRNSTEKQAAGG